MTEVIHIQLVPVALYDEVTNKWTPAVEVWQDGVFVEHKKMWFQLESEIMANAHAGNFAVSIQCDSRPTIDNLLCALGGDNESST